MKTMTKEEIKPLSLEETKLKEEIKGCCLIKGKYIDENTKAIFNMLCHLEDFEIEYWNLQQENKKLQERIQKTKDYVENHIKLEVDDAWNGMNFVSYHFYDFEKEDLLNLLEGDKE